MKLIKIIKARHVLKSHFDEKISPMVAYKIMKFIKSTDDESEFYSDKLKKIIEDYGLRDDKGNLKLDDCGGVLIAPAKLNKCNELILELQNTEVDNPIVRFSLDELNEFKLSVADLSILEDFLKIEEGE
ncbi:MAG: hypothetical protein ACI4M6_05505 [Christensenellaceae bacterium]